MNQDFKYKALLPISRKRSKSLFIERLDLCALLYQFADDFRLENDYFDYDSNKNYLFYVASIDETYKKQVIATHGIKDKDLMKNPFLSFTTPYVRFAEIILEAFTIAICYNVSGKEFSLFKMPTKKSDNNLPSWINLTTRLYHTKQLSFDITNKDKFLSDFNYIAIQLFLRDIAYSGDLFTHQLEGLDDEESVSVSVDYYLETGIRKQAPIRFEPDGELFEIDNNRIKLLYSRIAKALGYIHV